MNTDDQIFVGGEDFKFFLSIPPDEKILCLYDLFFESPEMPSINDIIDDSIRDEKTANVVVSNDTVVINAPSYKVARTAAEYFFMSGYVLERLFLDPGTMTTYQRQKYCLVYEIHGLIPALDLN